MAKEVTESGAKPEKKQENFFKRFGRKVAAWFRGMRSELKKVVWPTRKQTINNTIVAIVVMVVAGIVLWAFDELALLIVNSLISLGA